MKLKGKVQKAIWGGFYSSFKRKHIERNIQVCSHFVPWELGYVQTYSGSLAVFFSPRREDQTVDSCADVITDGLSDNRVLMLSLTSVLTKMLSLPGCWTDL